MTDILAVLYRVKQFIFEYGPLFLAVWFGMAVATGLITMVRRRRANLTPGASPVKRRPLERLWRPLLFLLWRPAGNGPALSSFGGLLLFSLAASVPALVATSIISMEVVWLRLILAVPYSLLAHWLLTYVLSRGGASSKGQQLKAGFGPQAEALSDDSLPLARDRRLSSIIQVVWRSFTRQIDGAMVQLLLSFVLASALTIYVPAQAMRSWLGEGAWQGPYLAVLLATPFQLGGGAEVPLASALLVKGASYGTALSFMLAAPTVVLPVIRHVYRQMHLGGVVRYLVAAWLVAGSLGVVTDVVLRVASRQ